MKERNIYEAVRIYVKNGLCGHIEMTNHNEKVSSYEVLSIFIKSLNLVVIVCSIQTLMYVY